MQQKRYRRKRMNARQKAKYWKKKYRELESLPVRPTIVVSDRELETLSYTTVIDDEVRIRQILDNTGLQKMTLDNVMNHLAELVKFYVDISVEKDEINQRMKITGRLNIARPLRDYHDIYNTYRDVMHDTKGK
jgi:hypothetical protein